MENVRNVSFFVMNARHVYRWNQRLQAGVSVLPCPEPRERNEICDADFTFCHIVSGHGCYVDGDGRSFHYNAGSLLLRFPGVRHSQVHEPGDDYIDCFLVLPKEFAVLLMERVLCSPEHPVIELGVCPGLPGEFAVLTDRLAEAPEERLIAVAAEFFRFVCDLLLRAGVDDPRRAAVMAAAERLDADEDIPVRRIAAECGVSHSTLRRNFAEFLGMSPVEYRIRRRIERIQSLLRTTTLTQKEIAARFGYADVYTFHRQFKRYTGMTPNEFRSR